MNTTLTALIPHAVMLVLFLVASGMLRRGGFRANILLAIGFFFTIVAYPVYAVSVHHQLATPMVVVAVALLSLSRRAGTSPGGSEEYDQALSIIEQLKREGFAPQGKIIAKADELQRDPRARRCLDLLNKAVDAAENGVAMVSSSQFAQRREQQPGLVDRHKRNLASYIDLRGMLYRMMNQNELAAADYERSMEQLEETDEDYPDYGLWKGKFLYKRAELAQVTGKREEARRLYQESIALAKQRNDHDEASLIGRILESL